MLQFLSVDFYFQSMKAQTRALEKNLEKRHTYVTKDDDLVLAETKGKPINVEGYLFKRGQNAFRTWNRRWFYLDSNKVKALSEILVFIAWEIRIFVIVFSI